MIRSHRYVFVHKNNTGYDFQIILRRRLLKPAAHLKEKVCQHPNFQLIIFNHEPVLYN